MFATLKGPAAQGAAARRDRDGRGGQRLGGRPMTSPTTTPASLLDPEPEGSAFVPDAKEMRREILRLVEERTVGSDNAVAWNGKRLQLPESRLTPAFRQGAGQGPRISRRKLRALPWPAPARRRRRSGRSPRPDCAEAWRRARGRQGQALSGALSARPRPPLRATPVPLSQAGTRKRPPSRTRKRPDPTPATGAA